MKIVIPQITDNDMKVVVAKWLVANKEKVSKGQDVADLITSKAAVTIEAPIEGYISFFAEEGSSVGIGEPLAEVVASIEQIEHMMSNRVLGESGNKVFSQKAKRMLPKTNSILKSNQKYITSYDLKNEEERGQRTNNMTSVLSIQIPLKTLKEESIKKSFPISTILLKKISEGSFIWLEKQKSSLIEKGYDKKRLELGFNYIFDLGTKVHPVLLEPKDNWSEEKWHEELWRWSLKVMRNKVSIHKLQMGWYSISSLLNQNISYFQPDRSSEQLFALGVSINSDLDILTIVSSFDSEKISGKQMMVLLNHLRY